MQKNMPKSIRKYIRLEKAKIRKMPLDMAEKEKLISALYQKFNLVKNVDSGNTQTGDK